MKFAPEPDSGALGSIGSWSLPLLVTAPSIRLPTEFRLFKVEVRALCSPFVIMTVKAGNLLPSQHLLTLLIHITYISSTPIY